MATTSDIAADRLRSLIERIERLEEEKKGIGEDIKDVYAEAKATGYDPAIMRKVVVLPQPEGPSIAKNVPSSIVKVEPSTAVN